MDLTVCFRTYDSYGGHVSLALIGDFLLWDAPHFGNAIDEIEVIMNFRSHGPPRKTLESLFERHITWLDQLPKVTLARKKRRIEVSFESVLATEKEITKSRDLSLGLFCGGCREVVENLYLLKTRIRKDDDFDFRSFKSRLDQRLLQLPNDAGELTILQANIQARRKAASASFSEWDKLAIDFDDFHPEARSLLNDPFLWDVCDDFSPNGNDTGADVLELYREWRKKNRKTQTVTFFKQVMHGWGVRVPPDPSDGYSLHMYNQAVVGLAFAELKLHAKCSPEIAELALQALEVERTMPEPEHWDTATRSARRKSIGQLTGILRGCN